MIFWNRFCPSLLAGLLMLVAGCAPSGSTALDEEKEPHFVLGNSRFNSMDYGGAIEAFQQALEVNPRSAQAHFRLAQLFDAKQPDPAAAIFHYQEYLRLNPRADNSEVIRQRIIACKQQLAADVMAMPSAPAAMRQIEDLTEKNRQLQQQVDQLNEAVKQWKDLASRQPAPQFPAPGNSFQPDDISTPLPTPRPAPPENRNPPPTVTKKTHKVAAGETMASIARKRGVSLTALQAANPGVNPKKLKLGQLLNVP